MTNRGAKGAAPGGYLAQHGATLIDNGYTVIPIQPGKKAPGFDGWQRSKASKAQLDEWLSSGHRQSGVGILTKTTPAIDIDVRDEDVALQMEEFVCNEIAAGILRIGQAPKRLMLFRCDEPFRKMRSTKYVDEWGDEHQIEILGDGQQFVAFHKHPDTGRPYTWPNGDSPLNVRAADLPSLTIEHAQAVIDHFESLADAAGWEILKKGHKQAATVDVDNPWVEDTTPISVSDDDLMRHLMLVPHPDDYDEWVRVGMALYHQYDGGETGLKMWHEWAESADNYDADALDRRWDGFEVGGKRRAPITARYIIKLSKEAVANTTAELSMKLMTAFRSASDLAEWDMAKQMTQEAEIDGLVRSTLAQVAKERRDAITGAKTALTEIKKAISYAPKKSARVPSWCLPWVYDVSDDRFYNMSTKVSTTQQGFNAMYDRNAFTKRDLLDGRQSPSSTASALALNVYQIPTVDGRRYEPGGDSILIEKDGTFANTYPEHEIPPKPSKVTPRDKANVEIVRRHIAHLLPEAREQAMLLDWLSWIVQNPGKHVNYSIVLQGVQGDGKTFFAEMMRNVMGPTNVTMLNAHILHSDFTDWAVGQCLAAIEEIRLINERNKYEILNRIKPFITNNIIEVHPKGKPVRNVHNTTSYLLFSNYRDCLPIDHNDRRYLPLFSRWQKREDIEAFKEENPDYYAKLYGAIEVSPGAIRQWLLHHEQSDEFNPQGDAPDTPARQFMIRQAQPEFIQELNDIIREGRVAEISDDLLDVTFLSDYMISIGLDFPAPKTLAMMLQRDGFEFMGRCLLDDGRRPHLWSKKPERFTYDAGDGKPPTINNKAVRKYLKTREAEIKDDTL